MSVFARLLLRYGSGFLVAKGFLAPDVGNVLGTDPEVLQGVTIALGTAIGLGTEIWYWVAKKFGWST